MANHKETPLGELLQMDSSKMLQPHYAEGWTLVELLASQPGKFGKLLLTLREGDSELAAIDKVYGWDEKKLTTEWRHTSEKRSELIFGPKTLENREKIILTPFCLEPSETRRFLMRIAFCSLFAAIFFAASCPLVGCSE